MIHSEAKELLRTSSIKLPPALLPLTPIQSHFLRNRRTLHPQAHRFQVLSAGRRSRKTLLGKRRLFYESIGQVNKRYFAGAPIRKQAKEIFWSDLKNYLKIFTVGRPSESDLVINLFNGTEVHVIGLDRPERIEGQPWDGCIITEFPNIKPRAWAENIRPALADTNGWAILEGVPEGRDHYFTMASYNAGGALPPTIPYYGAYGLNPEDPEVCFYSWFSSDVLPVSEIESARRTLDPRTFRQEYEGSFEGYEGLLYYAFSQENEDADKTVRDLDRPVILTCDFNKSPMVWEVGQMTKAYQAGREYKAVKIVQEISIPLFAKTPAAVRLFLDYMEDHQNKTIFLTGDASGQWEGHKDHSTDYVIIRDSLREAGYKVFMRVPSHNPSVNNRVNIVNSLCKTASDLVRLWIVPTATYLLTDLRQNEGDDKGGKNKDDDERTHGSDALDALIWLEFADEFYKMKGN